MPADVLFLGEGPGVSEDVSSVPFFGKAGKMFDKIIEATEINFTYYVTNVVLCHPTDSRGGRNREPTEDEVLACRPNIMTIYEEIKPKKTIFVGKVSELYYKKVLRPNYTMLHPSFINRTGGRGSPHFLPTVSRLREVLCDFAV